MQPPPVPELPRYTPKMMEHIRTDHDLRQSYLRDPEPIERVLLSLENPYDVVMGRLSLS